PARTLRLADAGGQPRRDVGGVLAQSRDEFSVPVMVQIVLGDAGRNRDLAVAAPVVIVARVQRLVHIANEMQQELQRETPLPLTRAGILKLGGEFVDLVDHAVLRGPFRGIGPRRDLRLTEAGAADVGSRQFEIHEMPAARLHVADPGGVPIGITVLVRPGRLMRDVPCGQPGLVAREQGLHPPANRGLKVVIRDQPDHFVALIAPGESGRSARQTKSRGAERARERGHEPARAAHVPKPRQPSKNRATTLSAHASSSGCVMGAPNPNARRCGRETTMNMNCCAAKARSSGRSLASGSSRSSRLLMSAMPSLVLPSLATARTSSGKRPDSACTSRCSAMACGDSAARRMNPARRRSTSGSVAPAIRGTSGGGRMRSMMRCTWAAKRAGFSPNPSPKV